MANPAVTEPGGTSSITAEVVNPDSIPLTFSWVASGGSISGAGAQALWVAPPSTGEFTISVVIKDSKGRTDSGSIGVYVQAASSSQPAPTPTPTAPKITTLTADPTVTEPSGTSSITAEVANPDNVPLTFSWVASGGNISGAEARALWVAPQSTGEFTISVIAKDSYGRTASGSIGVNVQASSTAPAPIPTPTETRDPAAWPFDTSSPWNYPTGSGATYQQVVTGYGTGVRGGSANIEWYSIPTYLASSSDPVRKIYNRQNTSFPGKLVAEIRVPSGALPSQGTDGHLNVIDETHRWVDELYAVQFTGSGDISTWGYIRNDLRALGAFNVWHGTVAAGTSSLGGMVRKGELVSGTAGLSTGIRHPLQGIFGVMLLNRNAPGGRSFVWPASSSDNPTTYVTSGNVYMGSLLAIPPSIDIKALGITHPQVLEIARALQDYGVYIVDQGSIGNNRVVIKIDPQASRDIQNKTLWDQQISIPFRFLQLMANSHNNGFAPQVPGGGGTPRRPLAPPLNTGGGLHTSNHLASLPARLPGSSELVPLLAITAFASIRHGPARRRRARSGESKISKS